MLSEPERLLPWLLEPLEPQESEWLGPALGRLGSGSLLALERWQRILLVSLLERLVLPWLLQPAVGKRPEAS